MWPLHKALVSSLAISTLLCAKHAGQWVRAYNECELVVILFCSSLFWKITFHIRKLRSQMFIRETETDQHSFANCIDNTKSNDLDLCDWFQCYFFWLFFFWNAFKMDDKIKWICLLISHFDLIKIIFLIWFCPKLFFSFPFHCSHTQGEFSASAIECMWACVWFWRCERCQCICMWRE